MTGTLRGEGIIQVEGTVEGEIDLQGAVIVASTGMVKGPVTADVIRMAGRIEGVVAAKERLLPYIRLLGELHCALAALAERTVEGVCGIPLGRT